MDVQGWTMETQPRFPDHAETGADVSYRFEQRKCRLLIARKGTY